MIAPERILIACQGPGREPYTKETINLFRTLIKFGGSLSKSQKVACFTEPLQSEIAEKLTELGVVIKIVDGLDERCVHASKIQNLSLYEDEDFDLLVSLDTDIVVANDFSKYIDESAVGAKPVDQDPLSIEQWQRLFSYFDLNLPIERYLTSFHYTYTIPYFNSGVLLVPRRFVQNLYESWKSFVKKLLESYKNLGDISTNSFFTDQFALSLALAETKIPHKALPLEMNFPTHYDIHKNFEPEKLQPYLIHYHHLSQSKTISHSSYQNINKIIDEINNHLILDSPEIISQNENPFDSSSYINSFDNEKFWENRYQTNLEIGSGVGSRGKHLLYKKNFIGNILASYNPTSVLDIGCGDLEVVKDLAFKNYLGIDISESITTINKSKKPDWNFISGNFIKIASKNKLNADLVICNDVLIHQHRYDQYLEFVQLLVKSCNMVGIVGAYEWMPRNKYRNEIVAYHEPITKTLRKFGIYNMKIAGVYRDVCLILFNKTENQ